MKDGKLQCPLFQTEDCDLRGCPQFLVVSNVKYDEHRQCYVYGGYCTVGGNLRFFGDVYEDFFIPAPQPKRRKAKDVSEMSAGEAAKKVQRDAAWGVLMAKQKIDSHSYMMASAFAIKSNPQKQGYRNDENGRRSLAQWLRRKYRLSSE